MTGEQLAVVELLLSAVVGEQYLWIASAGDRLDALVERTIGEQPIASINFMQVVVVVVLQSGVVRVLVVWWLSWLSLSSFRNTGLSTARAAHESIRTPSSGDDRFTFTAKECNDDDATSDDERLWVRGVGSSLGGGDGVITKFTVKSDDGSGLSMKEEERVVGPSVFCS
jgi:hypothetical protein